MRKLTFVCCFVVAALLSVDSPAFAHGQGGGQGGGRGQGGGQEQAPAKPPVSSPAPSSGTQGSKGEPSKAGRDQAKDREQAKEHGATEALHKSPGLTKSMGDLLPGQDLDAASSGFRNLGQFVATAEVSKNTGIPFNELKTRVVDRKMNLGQAIKDARPELDASAEARKAETAARDRVSKAERVR
jgi:hypothetical protein